MRARLLGRYGLCRGMEFEIGEAAVIGRGEDSDIVIEQGPVSKRHARLELDAETDRYWLEDLDSLNGTEVDGERVRGREPLSHLHVLSFGGCELIFQDLVRCAARHAAPAQAGVAAPREEAPKPERSPQPDAAKPQVGEAVDRPVDESVEDDTFVDREAPRLPAAFAGAGSRDASEEAQREGTLEEEGVVALPSFLASVPTVPRSEPETPSGPEPEPGPAFGKTMQMEQVPATPDSLRAPSEEARQPLFQLEVDTVRERLRFALGEGDHVIGRGGDCDVQLEIDSLSRRHARLGIGRQRITLCDLGSRNGTYIDGEAVTGEAVEIGPHQEILFGVIKARLVPTNVEGE